MDPPEFRLRVGDFRVRFPVDDATLRVLRVLNRKGAYRYLAEMGVCGSRQLRPPLRGPSTVL